MGTLQAPIVDGLVGVAVNVTWAEFPTETEQVPDDVPLVSVQFMPAGLLVAVPLPVPAKATVTSLASVKVVCACDWLLLAVR